MLKDLNIPECVQPGGGGNEVSLANISLINAVKSVEILGTYIYMLQIHAMDHDTPNNKNHYEFAKQNGYSSYIAVFIMPFFSSFVE